MTDPALPGWTTLLSGGVVVERTVNVDVRTFVTRELGADDDYLEERIRTVFLGGAPVDDVDTAMVRPGARLTLCTALPGAMGICMRRDSPLKAYRPSITHCEDCEELVDPLPGRVELKLLNFIAREMGPGVLSRGVLVEAVRLAELLARQGAGLSEKIAEARMDGEPVAPGELGTRLTDAGEVRLVVRPD